ncbi:gamma-glutamylcyclotransferase [Radiobacillus sp. PE A8.2]|uniref:gamma-glutamylcyclotransferase n=1 Tax=Radiobacillus sp. PE A8.2 TaxID=3380349 RepID=UPI00388F7D98
MYKRVSVQVVPFDDRNSMEATTYGVVNKEASEVEPSKEYIKIILDGAKKLFETYRENLIERFKHVLD